MDTVSLLEGFVLGLVFSSIFLIALYFQLKDIAKAIRNPKDNPTRNILGQIKKAEIVSRISPVDSFLE